MRIVPLTLGALALIFTVGTTGQTQAAERAVAGELHMTDTRQLAVEIPGTEDHAVQLAESRGTNRSTGPEAFLDGAEVTNVGFSDVQAGSGPQQGYITFTQDDSRIVGRWAGTVVVTTSPEGVPHVSMEGTWEFTRGTGEFEGMRGNGTFSGNYIDSDRYIVRWRGMVAD
jgi:hypothetical protein